MDRAEPSASATIAKLTPGEVPITFSGPMVRAILEGRKTQTRRVVHWPTWIADRQQAARDLGRGAWISHFEAGYPMRRMAPRYTLGMRLWVRENLRCDGCGVWRYGADSAVVEVQHDQVLAMRAWTHHKEGECCSSMFMPRFASRLTLEITAVRVEPVQKITQADVEAEGLSPGMASADGSWNWRAHFASVWDTLNAKRGYGWAENPWVWIIGFGIF